MASQKHLPALDGIRGLAILIVFSYHYGGGGQSSNFALHVFGTVLRAGWSGVSLFFILSGFLISGILWDGRGASGWWRRFYMRRTLRIFPLYYGALAIAFVSAVIAGNTSLALRHIWIYAFYLQNFPPLAIAAKTLGTPLVLLHFWSLAVEEQFYLLWPWMLTRMKTLTHARMLCLAVIAASALFRIYSGLVALGQVPDESFIASRGGELAAGAWLAMCYRTPELWHRLQRLAPAISLLAFGGFFTVGAMAHSFSLTDPMRSMPVYQLGLPLVTVGYGALLVLALGKGMVHRVMGIGWLRWFGTISYGFYVFHVLFAPVFDWITASLAPHAGRNTHLGLRFVVAALGSTALAWFSFRYFETSFLRRRDSYRASSQTVVVARP